VTCEEILFVVSSFISLVYIEEDGICPTLNCSINGVVIAGFWPSPLYRHQV